MLSALDMGSSRAHKPKHRTDMATILVVEDNPDLLAILRDLLSVEHQVETARRGEEAVDRAREVEPDVVIMDLQLPTMSGIEAGRWIKQEVGDVPILALTAMAQSGDADMVLRSGCCDAYMAKPASLADIRRKVEELLLSREAA
jgi:two-component system, cell cycle response regulator DivK